MTQLEIKEKIDANNKVIESLLNPNMFTLNNTIKELLKENKLNNKQIATLVKCDPSVVSNINYGKAYFDSNLTYPLRKS